MLILSNLLNILKDYCLNSSLTGFNYVANRKYYWIERLFWLVCLIISWAGSYYLISSYLESFAKNSVSMLIEHLRPGARTKFPSIGVCEMGYSKQNYEALEYIIEGMKLNNETEYNYDVEDFMLRIIFHNLYNYGSITSYCSPYLNCTDCIRCPNDRYEEYAEIVRTNCSTLFEKCVWNEKEFDCCRYFMPLKTTMGTCFLLNSIQVEHKHPERSFLKMPVDWISGPGHLQFTFSKATAVYIINEEDIPHMLLTTLQFLLLSEGTETNLMLNLHNTVNDDGVEDVPTDIRKCMFPTEAQDSHYKYYSYSTCVTECLKLAQIKACNCTHYNLIFNEYDTSPVCGYTGLFCLDRYDLMFPQTTIMQPWRTNGLVCKCLPSCNENEIQVIGRVSEISSKESRSIDIQLNSLPVQRYRRQLVREKIDIVVSIGGILGLFMGASILSMVEFIYFFVIRIIKR